MSEVEIRIDPDKVTLGFLYDLEEAGASNSIRRMIDLFVNGLGIDREKLRAMKPSQLKQLSEKIKDATSVGNESA
jgi:hypothetical protein